jgi:RNA polymerase sigma-70 factor (ECF subfamily)
MDLVNRIIDLIKNREERGMALLYDKYSIALYGIAFRIIGDKKFAEDVLNKSFLKIWDNIEKYDKSKGEFFTWMSRIVKNSSIDMKRSKIFIQSSKMDDISLVKSEIDLNENTTAKIDTAKLLNGLDEKYSTVLDYLYLRGYTQKELSEELFIPLGTVKTRVKKALDILRHNLKDEINIFTILLTLVSLIIIILIL